MPLDVLRAQRAEVVARLDSDVVLVCRSGQRATQAEGALRGAGVASGRVDLKPLVTHRFKLDEIEAAYDLFAHQRDGVLKVAITP